MNPLPVEYKKPDRKLIKPVLAATIITLYMAGHSDAWASRDNNAAWFGPAQNGIITKKRSGARKNWAKPRTRAKPGRKHAALRQQARSRAPLRKFATRSTKGMSRAFVGSYAPGSIVAKAPIFSRTTLDATRSAVSRYEAILRAGGWKSIPRGKQMKPGDTGPRIALAKQRLMRTRDLPLARTITNRFDEATTDAVKRFQKRHGLKADGTIGAKTLRAMNISAAKRLYQLKLNLTRLEKKLQNTLPRRFVMVNIPDYELQVVENNIIRARHNVVVGRASRQTDIITTRITQTNFYPYWHVPQSIVNKDLLPRLRKGENLLYKMRMQVSKKWGGKALDPRLIDWNSPQAAMLKFRQEPGVDNALGMLRINMPNRHAIYLHDTPTQNLLARHERAYSSGCVRVKDVFKLAKWLLEKNEGWDTKRIEATIQAGKSRTVTLKKPVPVYFDYITAWAGANGAVQFRRDIYHRDGSMKLAANIKPR